MNEERKTKSGTKVAQSHGSQQDDCVIRKPPYRWPLRKITQYNSIIDPGDWANTHPHLSRKPNQAKKISEKQRRQQSNPTNSMPEKHGFDEVTGRGECGEEEIGVDPILLGGAPRHGVGTAARVSSPKRGRTGSAETLQFITLGERQAAAAGRRVDPTPPQLAGAALKTGRRCGARKARDTGPRIY
jgi:hypothetical protein